MALAHHPTQLRHRVLKLGQRSLASREEVLQYHAGRFTIVRCLLGYRVWLFVCPKPHCPLHQCVHLSEAQHQFCAALLLLLLLYHTPKLLPNSASDSLFQCLGKYLYVTF